MSASVKPRGGGGGGAQKPVFINIFFVQTTSIVIRSMRALPFIWYIGI